MFSLAVRRELASQHSQAYFEFVEVCACHVDEDIGSIHCYLGGFGVNDGWQGEYCAVLVVEDRIFIEVFDYAQIVLEFLVLSECVEYLDCIHFFRLLECLEHYLLGLHSLIIHWSLHLIVIMGAH
jgi:hypothetical protein